MTPMNRLIAISAMATCATLLVAACHSVTSVPANAGADGLVVATTAGSVQGVAEDSVHVFKGIPYAASPEGAARWTPPKPVPDWDGVLQATSFGPSCIAPTRVVASIYASDITPHSEDCLTVNVWAPADASDAPVYFWIHGGALIHGSSKETLYDGSELARRGLVVVSINYRLGVLGYLAHPELSAESPRGISGNYGLLDQIEALRWVQANIAAFGGDASRVTIAGESAGALSVMYLLASPEARGLFSGAIMQSAYMVSMPTLAEARHGYPTAEATGVGLGAALNAPDLAALRALDAQALTDGAAVNRYLAMGTVDGVVLTDQLVNVFDRGEQAAVPILAGFNSGEIRSMPILAPSAPASAEAYEAVIRDRYADLADAFLALYPSDELQESIYATTRDALYGWTAERLARNQTALGQPAYLYLFDHGYPAADEAGLHAFHASELPYTWGNLDRTPPSWPVIPDTDDEVAFSDALVGYWSSFTRDGRPTAANQADWPAYGDDDAGAYLLLGETPEPATDLMPGMYELHETTVCRRQASGTWPWHWNTGLISPPLAVDDDTVCR